MANLMLIIKNISIIQYLINYIIDSCKYLRIHHISFDIDESLQYYSENHFDIDVILTDLNINEINKFIDLSKKTIKVDISKLIVIYSSDDVFLKQINNNKSIFISNDYDKIIGQVNNIILNKSNKNLKYINKIINNYLLNLGYKHSHKGTQYLYEIIYYLIINQYKSCPNLTKAVYPYIAKKFSTTIHNVKCDIVLSTKYMNSKTTLTKLKKNTLFKVDDYINTVSVINYILKKKQSPHPDRHSD